MLNTMPRVVMQTSGTAPALQIDGFVSLNERLPDQWISIE
jgi:hypothetical protein